MVGRLHFWVEGVVNISDHFPIFLQLEGVVDTICYSFKFNHVWLEDPNFKLIIRHEWYRLLRLGGSSAMDWMVYKLKCLKSVVST